MLKQTAEYDLPSPIHDVVLDGGRAIVALEAGVGVLERGALARTLDVATHALVASDDGQSVLGLSAPIDPPARRISPPKERPCTRRVYRLRRPWASYEDLGVVSVEGWSATYDGRHWPTYEGDFVTMFECVGASFGVRARFETLWPYHIERIARGIWLETSSLGAEHFVVLSSPDLRELERGNLDRCKIDFPNEHFSHTANAPTLAQPIFCVAGDGAFRRTTAAVDDPVVHHPVKNVHRVVTLDGSVIARLPAPAAGLAAESDRALVWYPEKGGLTFLFVSLREAWVKRRFSIAGATKAGARLFGRKVAVWVGATLRVFRDVGDA
ncbi:MAG TPA: hypothetical protein VFS43_35725 [Polyangiaceae bacterium]|nr:hypothetical protein [Polyangiaceae bacterium]